MQQAATRPAPPVLTGPMRDATSWLTWLAEAFTFAPDRYHHMHAVWQRAVELRDLDIRWLEPDMQQRLELAALLHDVGRALDPDNTEPHGLVGARFLDDLGLHDIAPLVAHHSGARLEAEARGMSDGDRWHASEPDLLAVLTFLDRTTSPSGERVTLAQRRDGVVARYGADSRQARNFDATQDEVHRAQQLLAP